MSEQKKITINGVHYDHSSGHPIQPSSRANTIARTPQHSQAMHRRQAKSIALNRAFIAKQQQKQQSQQLHQKVSVRPPATARSHNASQTIVRSPHISRFAKEPQTVSVPAIKDIGPIAHPVVKRAEKIHHAKHAAAKPTQPTTPAQVKNTAIEQALKSAKPSAKEQRSHKKWNSFFSIASSTLAVVLLAGYFTYINIPNLSVRVAAAQAGIDAKYPEYRPIGYRLNGPVAYNDTNKQVSMNFKSNSSPQTFMLNQTKSTWDSSALLEKHVDPKSHGDYATYSDSGLTIYTYDNSAAWVNNGILYTIDGTASLSNDQVRSMATSL